MTLSAGAIRALRIAATLVDVIPSARLRIGNGHHHLLTVSRTGMEPRTRTMPVCSFRSAVGQAHRLHQQGIRLYFLDVAPDREPTIDLGLRAGDATLPGEIYRVTTGSGEQLFLFVSELGVKACEQSVAAAMSTTKNDRARTASGADPIPARRVGFHADPVTELTVVHMMSALDEAERTACLMSRLLEICVAQEIIASVASSWSSTREVSP